MKNRTELWNPTAKGRVDRFVRGEIIGSDGAVIVPKLTYYGGKVLVKPKLHIVFVGQSWLVDDRALCMETVSFIDWYLKKGGVCEQTVSEYMNVGSGAGSNASGSGPEVGMGLGLFEGQKVDHAIILGTKEVRVTDSQLQEVVAEYGAKLDKEYGAGTWTPDSIACFMLGRGIRLFPDEDGDGGSSGAGDGGSSGVEGNCVDWCGYHDAVDLQKISGGKYWNGLAGDAQYRYYIVCGYPYCVGCRGVADDGGVVSVLDGISATLSHEICECITDPVPGRGWYSLQDDGMGDGGQLGEVGDICAWNNKLVEGHRVQTQWSNVKGTCV